MKTGNKLFRESTKSVHVHDDSVMGILILFLSTSHKLGDIATKMQVDTEWKRKEFSKEKLNKNDKIFEALHCC